MFPTELKCVSTEVAVSAGMMQPGLKTPAQMLLLICIIFV
jgi:hypothetical protein